MIRVNRGNFFHRRTRFRDPGRTHDRSLPGV